MVGALMTDIDINMKVRDGIIEYRYHSGIRCLELYRNGQTYTIYLDERENRGLRRFLSGWKDMVRFK